MKSLIFAIILLLEFHWLQAQFPQRYSPCYTPNNEIGSCVPLKHCGNILSTLAKVAASPNDIDFFGSSICKEPSSNEIYVCCAPSSSNDISLPRPPNCGGVTIEYKIFGGQDAMLYEFPWMALLEYRGKNNQIKFTCSGSLISKRYVLTAAHCVTGKITRDYGPLLAVRFGEHDFNNEVDCDHSSCKADTLRVLPEEVIPHEEYYELSKNQQHDIALIRLDRNILFSASVRPICLPSVMPSSLNVRSGTQFTVAGWGRTSDEKPSPVKQKLNIDFVEQSKCREKFKTNKVDIVDTQICAGGEDQMDTCHGDSGGPLMHFRDGVWVLEGIISFGFRCGLRDWPGVHTRAVSYENWIMRHIRA